MAEVMEWCEREKRRQNKVALVVRNPFWDRFPWAMAYPLISIDIPLEEADKRSLVYDSRTKSLWRWDGERWIRIAEDFKVEGEHG